jgi:hypothetical protein
MSPTLNEIKKKLDGLFNNFKTDVSKLKDALLMKNK